MKRIVVLGGSGFFGGLIVARLRASGLQPVVASRSAGELRIDANNPDDIRSNLKQRDLVIDAAGPYQTRTSALIDAATRVGFDVIDLSDSADYTAMIYQREAPIRAAGIRVLTACSGLSTVTAHILKSTTLKNPDRVAVFLRPASRITAHTGAIQSFLPSIEGAVRGGLKLKSVDEVTLPPLFASLKRVEFIVDTGHTTGNFLLQFAWFRRWSADRPQMVANLARRFGNREGVIRFEVSAMLRRKTTTFSGPSAYMLAVVPAILAAKAIAEGKFPHRGLVPPTEHVDGDRLLDAVRAEGISIA